MSATSSSPPLSTPSRRRIRFAPDDEILNPDEPAIDSDDDDEVPSTPRPPIDPRMREFPSPTDSVSSVSSSEGPSTPSPLAGRTFVDLKSPYPAFGDPSDPVVLHPSLNMNASFIWDVAQTPEGFLHQCDSNPAAKWATDGEPLPDLTLTLDGIYEWKIDVIARGDDYPYPTMKDIFLSIYENMSKLVGKDVVERLHPHTRKRVFAAREVRCTEFSLNSAEEPLRRVDFLVGARRFLGVSASLGTQKLVLNVGTLPSRN